MLQTRCHWLKLQHCLRDLLPLGLKNCHLFLFPTACCSYRPKPLVLNCSQRVFFKKMTGHQYVILGSPRPSWFLSKADWLVMSSVIYDMLAKQLQLPVCSQTFHRVEEDQLWAVLKHFGLTCVNSVVAVQTLQSLSCTDPPDRTVLVYPVHLRSL